jgi:uncharacterized protein YihD (DUF1040 family)
MRDPKRIPVVIKALEALWMKQPDLRLCQLIENVGGSFYREDDDLLRVLKMHVKED